MSSLWKSQVCANVRMLPRDNMVRPLFSPMGRSSGIAHIPQSWTDVQEFKQHTGGDDLVLKVQAGLLNDLKGPLSTTSSSVAWVDIHGYDAALPRVILQGTVADPAADVVVASICHHKEEFEYVKRTIMQQVHTNGRELKVPGFPDIQAVLHASRTSTLEDSIAQKSFKVNRADRAWPPPGDPRTPP